MHDMKELRRLALIMFVGFVATVGVLRWRDTRDVPPAAVATTPPAPRSVPAGGRRAAPAVAAQPITAATPPPLTVPATAVTPAEEAAPPEPAPTLHVFVNRMRDPNRRRVRVANTGSEAVDCLVRIWRDGLLIGERQLEVRFNHEVTLGVEDDLEIHVGDRIVVQSNLGPPLADLNVS